MVQLPIRLAKAIPTVLSLERLQNEDLCNIMVTYGSNPVGSPTLNYFTLIDAYLVCGME